MQGVGLGESFVDYDIDSLPFWRNSYRITAIVHDKTSEVTFDCRQQEFGFNVMQGELGQGTGIVYLPGAWDLDGLRGEVQDFYKSHAEIAQLREQLGNDRAALEVFGALELGWWREEDLVAG